MDALDLKLSRKMQKLIRRVEQLVEKEMGEPMGVTLIVFPWSRPDEGSRIAEYQYASNAPRTHMHGSLKAIVTTWDAVYPDVPPHEKQ
jgi:hypothetical protein